MKVSDWMNENVASLSHTYSKLYILTRVFRDARSERFERADGKRYLMTEKSFPMPVSDLRNKHTVYYRHKRSYYNMRPPMTVRCDNESDVD